MVTLKEFPDEEYVLPGSAACPGCPATVGLRIVLKALGKRTILVIPACCTSVIESWYPSSSFDVPLLNIAFAASAAAASGVVSALKKKGKDDVNVVVWAGDGGTYDIGLQAISGAFERQTDFIYICYNNQIYSNTGIQRSGATPYGAWTTTTVGGKREFPKDMGAIVRAHKIPYAATASIAYPEDLYRKIVKAKGIRGPKYIEILAPCPPGWRFSMNLTIRMSKLSVETGIWPLYEYENGRMEFNGVSKAILEKKYKRKSIEEWLKLQGRFKHLFKPKKDEDRIERFQRHVDEMWEDFRKEFL